MSTNNDKIQFRGETEKKAAQVVDQMRLGGINISELARQGLQEELREVLSDKEKITLHQRYKQGEPSEDVAEILLGRRWKKLNGSGRPSRRLRSLIRLEFSRSKDGGR